MRVIVREWLARLADRLRRGRLEREFAEELEFHQEQLVQDALAAGADGRSARLVARRRLGDVMRIREEVREVWTISWVDRLQQDLRYALRGVYRAPGFTLAVTLTLGLGIGANVAMFAAVDRLIFRPLEQLRDPDTAHRIYLRWNGENGEEQIEQSMSYGRYLDLRQTTRSFSDFAVYSWSQMAVGIGDGTRVRQVFAVSASFFDFFDARPALGRFFAADEDVPPNGAPVAVLSHAFWQSELGGRADVLGTTLHVGDIAVTVIGVAPKRMTVAGLDELQPPVLFIPTATLASASGNRNPNFYGYYAGWAFVLVRRKPDVSVAAASADVGRAHRLSWDAERAASQGPQGGGRVLRSAEVAQPRGEVAAIRRAAGPNPIRETRIAHWLSGVAVLVLLIACSNIANLFLVRELSRAGETAVRRALGVTRGRLISQALAEGLIITLMGACLGLLLARWGVSSVQRLVTMMPWTSQPLAIFTDRRTVIVALLLAVAPGSIVAILPALAAARRNLAPTLRTGGRGVISYGGRVRAGLLLAQTALSVVLLVGALAFARSLDTLEALPLGYEPDEILVATPTFRATPLDDAGRAAVYRQLLAAAQAIPGVQAASWARTGPILGTLRQRLYVTGIDSVGALGDFVYNAVSPDYFRVIGTRIERGRGIAEQDRAGAPRVALVSERMAQALWPNQAAIGQCLRVGADTVPCTTVVGVTQDIVTNMWNQLEGRPQPFYAYMSVEQSNTGDGRILIRTSGDPATRAESVRRALQRALPGTSYVTVQPMRETLDIYHRPWQLGAKIFSTFGVLALVVAAVGLYGVISYNITQRMHELGVRVTLGAQRSDLVRLVVGQSTRLALAGVVLGLLLATAAGRWLQPLLFNQSATDPRVYAAVASLMIGVALAASAMPALRAARADPNRSLRPE